MLEDRSVTCAVLLEVVFSLNASIRVLTIGAAVAASLDASVDAGFGGSARGASDAASAAAVAFVA